MTAFISLTLPGRNQNLPTVHLAPSWGEPELVTDRPDQTESSRAVPQHKVQIEMGFSQENFHNEDTEFTDMALARTLIRYGLLERLEVRLGSGFQSSSLKTVSSGSDSTQQGLAPVTAGIKISVAEEKGWQPELALLADFTFNLAGSPDYRPTYNYSAIKLTASHTLSRIFSLGYNLGVAGNGEDPRLFFTYSLVTGASITRKLKVFVEGYGNFDQTYLPRHRFNGGFTYLVKSNFQLDISGGYGPKETYEMWFVSFGFSLRLPI